MKAVVTTGEKMKVVVKEVPDLQIQPGTLRVKVKYAAICGSDLEYLDRKGQTLKANVIRGHEFSGEVMEVGEGVEGVSVGDRVTYSGTFQRPCGRCYYCRRPLLRSNGNHRRPGHCCSRPLTDQSPGCDSYWSSRCRFHLFASSCCRLPR